MSRLLFAAARKARIQRLMQCPHRWENYQLVAPLRASDEDRIHPADEHLQYGPVSTALREMAEDARAENQPSWEMGLANFSANNFIDYYDWRWCEPDYPLYYLILAEFLADEGM
jgi:hypothetical protein